MLPAISKVTTAPDTLRDIGPFDTLSVPSGGRAYANAGASSYAVTAVTVWQTVAGAPLDLRFTTSALPLIQGIFGARNASLPVFTLSVQDRSGETRLWNTFSGLSVSSVVETRSRSLSGTATLAVSPR